MTLCFKNLGKIKFGNHEKLNFEPNIYKKERSIYMYFDHEFMQYGWYIVSAFVIIKSFGMDGISLTTGQL